MKLLASVGVLVLLLPVWVSAANVNCECVRYLREVHGVNIRGDAWTQKANIPFENMDVGDVLLMKIGRSYHVVVILAFEERVIWKGMIAPRYIVIADSNAVEPCTPSVRRIQIDDPDILGVYHPAP